MTDPAEGGSGPLTYAAVGVDIERKNEAVRRIQAHVARTRRPGVLGDIGAFGGLFALDLKKYPEPVLVAGTDGVGTKVKLAFLTGRHNTVGIDCVAMNCDDVVVQGAEPLFFLDYIGTAGIDPAVVEALVAGIAEGCVQAGCALIGGETAQMPGMYAPGEYDLTGTCIGMVNRDRIIDGKRIRVGNALVGLGSSGLHSNGYTLARRVLLKVDGGAFDLEEKPSELGGQTVADAMLTPTRIYARNILALRDHGIDLRGVAHITGGGVLENIPRVLPNALGADLHWGSWQVPPIFQLIQQVGHIAAGEMDLTFNNGLGMVLVVPQEQAEQCVEAARALGEQAAVVGAVRHAPVGEPPVRVLR